MRQSKSAQAGFSMVELLVAVVILAVGLLGLAELQVTAMKTNAQGHSIVAATSLAQQVIEQIVALPAEDPLLDAAGPATWTLPVGHPLAGLYNVTYNVAQNHEGITGLCRITVTVQSANPVANVLGSRVRRVDLATLKRST
jgi:type IV pilus assembly protein PilV